MTKISKCEHCESEFLRKRSNQRFCSSICSVKMRSNTDKYKKQVKEYRDNRKTEAKNYKKIYLEKNYDKVKQQQLNWINANKEQVKLIKTEYKRKNSEKFKEWHKTYNVINKEKLKTQAKEIRKKYPWRGACRRILRNSLRYLNTKKEEKTINLLGYSIIQLKEHLENQFQLGMSWDNYGQGIGKWNIDHIKAVTNFDPETPPSIVNALSNLQPLWAIDNIRKSNKIINNTNDK